MYSYNRHGGRTSAPPVLHWKALAMFEQELKSTHIVQLAEGVGPVQQLVVDQRHESEGVPAADAWCIIIYSTACQHQLSLHQNKENMSSAAGSLDLHMACA
jgi:hypothetical protein